MPAKATSVQRSDGHNYDGVWRASWQYEIWSRAMNKALRHSMDLPVDPQGFAYVEDIIYVLGDLTYYHLKAPPTVADLMFVLATQDKGRYQASSRAGTGNALDLLIRTVQATVPRLPGRSSPPAHTPMCGATTSTSWCTTPERRAS